MISKNVYHIAHCGCCLANPLSMSDSNYSCTSRLWCVHPQIKPSMVCDKGYDDAYHCFTTENQQANNSTASSICGLLKWNLYAVITTRHGVETESRTREHLTLNLVPRCTLVRFSGKSDTLARTDTGRSH